MKLNREKSLIIFRSMKNKVFEENRVFDSDGEIEDLGAVEFAAEIEEVIRALENPNLPDWEVILKATYVGLENELKGM